MKTLYLSFSSDQTYQTCGYKYKLEKVDRLSEIQESMATVFGKVIHTTIYLHLKSQIEAAAFNAVEFFESEMKSRASQSNLRLPAMWSLEDFIASGKLMMERFVAWWAKDEFEVVIDGAGEPILEREFKVMLPGNIVYTAIIDAVLRRKADGWIIVTDWKTPAAPSFPDFALLSEQLTGYQVVLEAFLESLGLEKLDGSMFVELIKRKVPVKRDAKGPTIEEPIVARMRTEQEKEQWLTARMDTAAGIRAGKFNRRPLSAFNSPCSLCGVLQACAYGSMEGLKVREPYRKAA